MDMSSLTYKWEKGHPIELKVSLSYGKPIEHFSQRIRFYFERREYCINIDKDYKEPWRN